MNNKNFIRIAGTVLTTASLIAGFATVANAADSSDVQTLLVGSGGTTKPFTYTDEDGKLTGFDIEVLQAVDEVLPQYEIEFEQVKFDGIFSGIDAGRYQIGANSISWREEREAKYNFTAKPYAYVGEVIVTRSDSGINSIEDLGGKRAVVTSDGNASDHFIEEYNEQHPDNPIIVTYADFEDAQIYQKIEAGELDFKFHETTSYEAIVSEFEFQNLTGVKLSLEETKQINDPAVYFVFPKTDDGAEIRDAVDGALDELRENGTLTEISEKFFGEDITQGADSTESTESAEIVESTAEVESSLSE